MLIIDPDGMFGGDRIAGLSDKAKLHWPWLYLGSNGYARIEINYRKIAGRIYGSFHSAPTEAELMELFREYADAYLLFIYRSPGGQIWGQWNVSARLLKFLPRYKTQADNNSPPPPAQPFDEWRARYSERKATPAFEALLNGSGNSSETFPEHFRNPSEGFPPAVAIAEAVAEAGAGAVVGAERSSNNSERVAAAAAGGRVIPLRSAQPAAEASSETPSTPTSPPASPEKAARQLVHTLAPKHPTPGNLGRAAEAATALLQKTADLPKRYQRMIDSHAAWCVWWTAEAKINPNTFIPQLHRWFQSGDWMHPPGEQSIHRQPPSSETQPQRKSARKAAWERA